MWKVVVLTVGFAAPSLAFACDKAASLASATPVSTAHAAAADSDPTSCAKKPGLVGANCSYTTGMMAQRVLAEGTPWSFTGSLTATDNALGTHVAAPYIVGPDKVNVVANEVLESLTEQGLQSGRVGLEGRKLEVDGVTYFVLTSYSVPSS